MKLKDCRGGVTAFAPVTIAQPCNRPSCKINWCIEVANANGDFWHVPARDLRKA